MGNIMTEDINVLAFLWALACGISISMMLYPWVLKFIVRPKIHIPLPIYWLCTVAGVIDMSINIRALDHILNLGTFVNPTYSLIIGLCMLIIGLVLIFLPCKLCLSIPDNPTKLQIVSIMSGLVFVSLSTAPLSFWISG